MSLVLPSLIQSLVDSSIDAVSVVDHDLNLLYFNANYLRLANMRRRSLTRETMRGLCHSHFGLATCDDTCLALRAWETRQPVRVDEVASHNFPIRLIVLAIPLFDENGDVYAVIEQYRDVTAESRMQENYRRLLDSERAQKERLQVEVTRKTQELEMAKANLEVALRNAEQAARTDALTQLANRRHFDKLLAQQLGVATRSGRDMSLVMFDLDHFKRVNDRMGHPAGDAVLRNFADALRAAVGEDDMVARIGGEEFALVLPGADRVKARRVALTVQLKAHEMGLPTTTSAGIACVPGDAQDIQALLSAADTALYAAKTGGRNQIVSVHQIRDEPTLFSGGKKDVA